MCCCSSRRRHTRWPRDWSSDVCSSDLSDSEERLRKQWEEVIDRAFAEDMSPEDVTTNAVAGPGRKAVAVWVAKQQGTLAGQIGRASCRERGWIAEGTGAVRNKAQR